ncbi:MAG: cytochrome c [Deltaproteobacteria bacterium]|nr:cytochrome c [Deltaproteobacteria bacterium]
MQGVIRFAVFVLVPLIYSCSFSSNGERIFFTATSKNGLITIKQGAPVMKMALKGCANCHGRDGKGGHALDATGMKGSDIRYKTLVLKYGGYLSYMEGKGDKISGGVDTLIKRAITEGEGQGYKLNIAMPRWAMSDEDLGDVIEYLKTL